MEISRVSCQRRCTNDVQLSHITRLNTQSIECLAGHPFRDVDGLFGGRSSPSKRESIRRKGFSRSARSCRLDCSPGEFSSNFELFQLPKEKKKNCNFQPGLSTISVVLSSFLLRLKLDADEAIPAAEVAADIAAQSEIFSGDNVPAVDVSFAASILLFFHFFFFFF